METGPLIQRQEGEAVVTGQQPQLARIFQRYQRRSNIFAASPARPRVPPEAAAAVPAPPPEYSAVLPAQPTHAKIRNRRGLPAIPLLALSSLNVLPFTPRSDGIFLVKNRRVPVPALRVCVMGCPAAAVLAPGPEGAAAKWRPRVGGVAERDAPVRRPLCSIPRAVALRCICLHGCTPTRHQLLKSVLDSSHT